MKGIGTKDKDLIRLIVCRYEVNYFSHLNQQYLIIYILFNNKKIDLPRIKSEYKQIYGKSLYEAVDIIHCIICLYNLILI